MPKLVLYLGFPECPCCLGCNIYSRLCHVYRLNDFLLTDDGLLFPSLYLYCIEINSAAVALKIDHR